MPKELKPAQERKEKFEALNRRPPGKGKKYTSVLVHSSMLLPFHQDFYLPSILTSVIKKVLRNLQIISEFPKILKFSKLTRYSLGIFSVDSHVVIYRRAIEDVLTQWVI